MINKQRFIQFKHSSGKQYLVSYIADDPTVVDCVREIGEPIRGDKPIVQFILNQNEKGNFINGKIPLIAYGTLTENI